MPYDPALPANHTKIVAAELRSQFNGVVDLIQTIPVGPTGPAGVNTAVIDGVTTGSPGDNAAATVTLNSGTLHFSFNIPRGDVGGQGATGGIGLTGGIGPVGPAFTSFVIDNVTTLDPAQPATVAAVYDGVNVKLAFGLPQGHEGAVGPQGNPGIGTQGPVGPAFTSFVIDSVTTLPPGQPATVQTFFDGTSVRFTFGIPQGPQGVQGNNGFDGQTGAQGPQGPAFTSFAVDTVNTLAAGQPATVQTSFDGTTVRFTFGIPEGQQGVPGPSDLTGTSNNSNSVAVLGMAVSDPPTQGEMQAIANKLDELIAALRR